MDWLVEQLHLFGRILVYLLPAVPETLRITIVAFLLALSVGMLVGIARTGGNRPFRIISAIYVDTLRGIPLLVQIIFWGAVIVSLGDLTFESGPIGCSTPGEGCEGWLFVSNKGISFPWLFPYTGFWQWVAFLAVGVVASIYVFRWRLRIKEVEGRETYALTWGTLTVVVFAISRSASPRS